MLQSKEPSKNEGKDGKDMGALPLKKAPKLKAARRKHLEEKLAYYEDQVSMVKFLLKAEDA